MFKNMIHLEWQALGIKKVLKFISCMDIQFPVFDH
jgi:hypothetical protein